jgi:hypothetical protein
MAAVGSSGLVMSEGSYWTPTRRRRSRWVLESGGKRKQRAVEMVRTIERQKMGKKSCRGFKKRVRL